MLRLSKPSGLLGKACVQPLRRSPAAAAAISPRRLRVPQAASTETQTDSKADTSTALDDAEADASLAITVAGAAGSYYRYSTVAVLPGHRAVLSAASPVFAQQLAQWDSGSAAAVPQAVIRAGGGALAARRPSQPTVIVTVDDEAGAVVAQMLYRAIYSGAKALDGASRSQLLAVTRLAHGVGVARIAELAARMLSEAASEELSWDEVDTVLALPAACRQSPAFAGMLAAAEERLHQGLGDLDAAMQDAQARGRLMALPLPTLRALLCDPRTRASCEATALAVASAWFADPAAAELRQRPGVREQHAAALADCVRFGRLSPMVLTTIAPHTEWVAAAVSHQQLLDVIAFATGGIRDQRQQVRAGGGLVGAHPRWFLPVRPPSAVEGAAFLLEAPAADLKAAAARARATGQAQPVEGCGPAFFAGFWWRPEIEVAPTRAGVRYDLRLRVESAGLFALHAGQRTACRVVLGGGSDGGGLPARARGALVSVDAGWLWRDCWGLGSAKGEWDADAFKAKGLMRGRSVHAKVQVKAT